ncbi:NUDIX hydrolase [Arthrobacter castelli]|uniref:NUDIX hydrolase n=1 Tax=Arthrobacter castelli TaxID=271431 RepID=UPI00040840E0|nr:NUDIX hydrolase [Arthrobacter castelli]
MPATAGEAAPEHLAVRAAGALCWRTVNGSLEVLIIHRPRYQDWSWPKGKLDDGETLPEAAVREVEEEVGLTVKLGLPLPSIHYRVNSGLKEVQYWAAQVNGADAVPDGDEVDRAEWVAPDKARGMLSNPSDIGPLDALEYWHDHGDLPTWPIILLRHAKAKPRSTWTLAEGDRTLVASGHRQAKAVGRLLSAWRPKRVLTSPWVRCVQTVKPYAKMADPKVKQIDALTEAAHKRQPKKARAVAEGVFDKRKPVIICSHRPVLPTLLTVFAERMSDVEAAKLPVSDPYLTPGEVLILHVSAQDNQRIVAVEQIKPYDD